MDHRGEDAGQALSAEFGRRRNAHPAANGILLIGLFESLRGRNAAVIMARAALLVAAPVERLYHLFA